MTVDVFASGSSGNCTLLSDGETHVLIDAGLSFRRLTAALAPHGLAPADLDAVLVTHEHNDHISGLPMLRRHCATPVIAPRTVANHIRWSVAGDDGYIREIAPGTPFAVGSLTITAFPTPHDTDQSVGYRLEGGARFGFCTDTGCVTEAMREGLSGCDAAVVEANHDLRMLLDGPYPAALKRRILSERGHLSNDSSAEFACALAGSGTRTLILGHLSRENNLPSLARGAVRSALDAAGFSGVRLEVAPVLGDLAVEVSPCWA